MKSFNEYLIENLGGDFGLDSTVPYDVDSQQVKNKLNAVLGHVAVSEFMNPMAAIQQMESKLSQLGLHKKVQSEGHGIVKEEEFSGSGEMTLEFTQFGGIFGKSVETAIDEFDKEEMNISLNVKYEQLETGSFKVYGSIA
jgi:hypothetical protein